MLDISTIQLTVTFNDPDLDPEDREEEAQRLARQLSDFDEVETVKRVVDPHPPAGNKSVGGFLVGILTTKIDSDGAKKVLGFLNERLMNKSIELEVEANGRRLKVVARSRLELEAAIQAAQKFIDV
jgi:hypothetical protein